MFYRSTASRDIHVLEMQYRNILNKSNCEEPCWIIGLMFRLFRYPVSLSGQPNTSREPRQQGRKAVVLHPGPLASSSWIQRPTAFGPRGSVESTLLWMDLSSSISLSSSSCHSPPKGPDLPPHAQRTHSSAA